MKILYFYPENPLLLTQGNNVRANSLLKYFKNRNIEVHFIGEASNNFKIDEAQKIIKQNLASKVFLLNHFRRSKNQLKYFIYKSLPRFIRGEIKFFDRLKPFQEKKFIEIINSENYDYIIISYAYWHKLIDKINRNNVKVIVDTHDFLTSQFQNQKKFNLGKYFSNEIKCLNKFDEIFVISIEEKYLFSQFINKPIHLVSHITESNETKSDKIYDLIYVASDNEHNIISINWFFNRVFPLLPKNIKILCIGKINKHFGNFENVDKIERVENLDDFYKTSKIVLCPMLSGTGLKIKVIEGLSYGLPIVCNERGVDGLLNKSNNGCLVTNEEITFSNYIIKLLENFEYYELISKQAKNYFEENHSINNSYKKLDKIFNL